MSTPFRDMRTVIALASLSSGEALRVVNLPDDKELAIHLRVLGLREGESVVLLRRAPLGGPLHLRTESGIEIALGRPAASLIFGERRESPP